MRKLLTRLTLIFILFIGCSGDDDTMDQDPIDVRLVKSEIVDEDFRVDYVYNSDSLLETWSGQRNNITYELNFVYDSNNRVTEEHYEEFGFTTYVSDTFFTYDSLGKLISYDEVNLSYNNNLVTATGNIEGADATIILELNEDGLVINITEDNNYTTFQYDDNGNLITAKNYDDAILVATYQMVYDNKINPFYGQFNSNYISKFLEFFNQFSGVFIGGFEGYNFPYQKNNLISVTEDLIVATTYDYEYSSDNHPIHTAEDYFGNTYSYEIEYY